MKGSILDLACQAAAHTKSVAACGPRERAKVALYAVKGMDEASLHTIYAPCNMSAISRPN